MHKAETLVVLVDDDAYLLEEIAPRLERSLPGVRVMPCYRASDALDAALASTGPTVVVTDFDLRAAKDGADLLAELESLRPAHGRVLMSGHSREAIAYAFVRCKPTAFVQKTATVDEMLDPLVQAIQSCLASDGKAPEPGAHETLGEVAHGMYALLVESVRDYAIYILDPKGRIVSWNPGAERITGYKAAEAMGLHFRMFYTPEDQERGLPERDLEAATLHGRCEEEGARIRKDGSRLWASVVLTALRGPDGALRGFAKITRDITQKKAAEEQLRRHARELEDLSQELEAFSYTLAHDIRGPLRAIAAALRVIDTGPGDPQRLARGLEAIRSNVRSMSALVDDLLQLAHATKGEIAPQRLDLSQLAREVAAAVLSRLGRPMSEVAIQDGLHALGDTRSMRVVLENLFSNAAKFTSRTQAPQIEFGRTQSPTGPVFYVRDNGAGFSPDQSGRLFRPFQRLHAPVDYEGTGLGLTTVRRIIERHGGRVWIEGSPGKGATVYFSLRPSSPQVASPEAQALTMA